MFADSHMVRLSSDRIFFKIKKYRKNGPPQQSGGVDFRQRQNGGQRDQRGFQGSRFGTHKPFQNPGMEVQHQQQ